MHRDQRNPECERRGFREIHADQQRADEPRGAGHRHSVNVLPCNAGGLQRTIRKLGNDFHMRAGRNLRDDAAINRVQRRLRKDLIRENLSSIFYDSYRRLVTGRFNCQNQHDSSTSFQYFVINTASSLGAS